MRATAPVIVLALLAAGQAAAADLTARHAQHRVAELRLTQRIEAIRRDAGARRVSVAFHDFETGARYTLAPAEYYAAASMIKVPVAIAVWTAIEHKKLALDTPVRVRNEFRSLVDGTPFSLPRSSELDERVHDAIGKTLPVAQLLHAMLATSSNLGTNVLLAHLGLSEARRSHDALGIPGLDFRRGLGDSRASDHGHANRVNAEGLEEVFSRLAEGRVVSRAASEWILASLFKQAVRSGIPHGLPPDVKPRARVSHKTGNISTVEHDAGLVYIPGRKPYALAILTEWPGRGRHHAHCIARVTLAVHEVLVSRVSARWRGQ